MTSTYGIERVKVRMQLNSSSMTLNGIPELNTGFHQPLTQHNAMQVTQLYRKAP